MFRTHVSQNAGDLPERLATCVLSAAGNPLGDALSAAAADAELKSKLQERQRLAG